MLLYLMVAGVLGVMLLFPDTPMARTLHGLLVETTARRLARIRPGHTLFALILVGVGLLLFGLFEAEGLRLFAFMAPDLVVWFSLFDVAVFLDVFVFAVAMGAAARFRAARDQVAGRLARVSSSLRVVLRTTGRQRSHRDRPRARPAPTDDPDPASFGQSPVFG